MRVKCSQRWSRAARCSSAGDKPATGTLIRMLLSRLGRLVLGRRGSVDLRHDVLDLGVVLERVGREVLAVPGLLVAAVRHLGHERNVVVDPDGAELELSRG